MPELQQIAEAITNRLDRAQAEIALLQAAREALTATSPAPATGRRSRRAAATPPIAAPAHPSERRPPAPDPEPTAAKPKPKPKTKTTASPSPGSRRTAEVPDTSIKSSDTVPPVEPPEASAASVKPEGKRRRRSGDLAPGQLESLLRESPDGLSLVALVSRTNVSEAKVRAGLQLLARTGEVVGSGSRRTSLWRLRSEDEQIAARVAELEQQMRGRPDPVA